MLYPFLDWPYNQELSDRDHLVQIFLKSIANKLLVTAHHSAAAGSDWSAQRRRGRVQLALALISLLRAGASCHSCGGEFIFDILSQLGSQQLGSVLSATNGHLQSAENG